MSCSNCFNGCSEIVSDQCVKYTGIDVPVLGIKTGDSLSYVEQALITFLTSTLDGTGIKPDIDPTIICTLVQQYLPTCGDITIVDLFNALIKAACDLQVQVAAVASTVANIESAYNTSCLSGVNGMSGTHSILQATIDNLCLLNSSVTALAIDVDTNYVKVADLCTLVTNCINNSNPGGTKHYLKMVPYTVVEYYGDIVGNFGTTGEGLGDWEKIYLCNGLNGTPDKRGRVGVGAIVGIPGGPLAPAVNPSSSPFNPSYALFDTAYGTNSVTLTTNQLPSHTHTAATTITPNPHKHTYIKPTGDGSATGIADNHPIGPLITENTSEVTLSASTNVNVTGGNEAHANNQPALACYYIMYIP